MPVSPLCFASALALAGIGSAADGVRLVRSLLEGDRIQMRAEVTLDIAGTLPASPPSGEEEPAEAKESPFEVRFHLSERTRDAVSKVVEGAPTEVEREILESKLESRLSAGEGEATESEIPRPLSGRTLALRREGDEVRVVRGVEGFPKDLADSIEIEHPLVRILPSREVKEGDTWEVDAALLAPFVRLGLAGAVEPFDLEGKIECTYEGEGTLDESKADSIEVEGKTKAVFGFALADGRRAHVPVDLALEGKAWFDRARGRFVRFEAKGEAERRAGSAPGEAVVPATAEGRLRLLLQFRDAAPDEDEEGLRLALRYKPGDQFTRKTTGTIEVRMDSYSVKVDGKPQGREGEAPEFAMRSTSEEETVEEILAVQDGSPTSKRIEFVRSKTVVTQDTAAGEEKEETGSEVEGAVVVVTREGEEVDVKVESGDVPEELKGALHPEDLAGFLLPNQKTKRGDSWLVEPSRFVDFLSGFLPIAGDDREAAQEAFQKFLSKIEGDLEARFAGTEEVEGTPAARVSLRGDLSLEPNARDFIELGIGVTGAEPEEEEIENLPDMELTIEVELRGELLFVVEEGRPLSLELSGPVRIRFRTEQSYGEHEAEIKAAFSGSLDFRLDVRRGRS